ncbi:MAG: Trm112 family protein [Hellea sp.]
MVKSKAKAHPPVIDPKMLGVLVCPKTRGPLTFDSATNELISKKAKLAFPIREGVPIMLIEEARELD